MRTATFTSTSIDQSIKQSITIFLCA